MMFLRGTHQGSDEISENMDQHTELVYWGRTDTHTLILDGFGSWSSVCVFWQHCSFFLLVVQYRGDEKMLVDSNGSLEEEDQSSLLLLILENLSCSL